ncbi:MAG: ABC transporter permease subunit [Clostridiales bacterium]|jgi:putative aldouronate transport system permease protein|nr:ABC transporter permease subunit [Clostridiales bacterium]
MAAVFVKKGGKNNRFTKGLMKNIFIRDIVKNKYIYIMLVPVGAYYVIFHYMPMYGAQIAFRNYAPLKGIWGSQWVGLQYFKEFFSSYYFTRLLRNTLLINFYDILFGFPAPVIMAILINELRGTTFRRMVQTITYLPHFISLVVVCGLLTDFLAHGGVINNIAALFGGSTSSILLEPKAFRAVYVGSEIWQSMGWNSIIYLSALMGIPSELYEAARMDGAGRLREIWSITLPGILPTVVIMLIMRVGKIMTVGAEKIILLYNPSTYETADVISSFVYRKGILEAGYSYSTAVGLFNSIISFVLVYTVNRISNKLTDSGLW